MLGNTHKRRTVNRMLNAPNHKHTSKLSFGLPPLATVFLPEMAWSSEDQTTASIIKSHSFYV
jgi:hypothetical protein